MSAARRDESGAALILAIVFVLICSVIVVGLAQMTTGAMVDTENLGTLRATVENANSATTLAVQYQRYNFQQNLWAASATEQTNPPGCLPPGATSSMVVYCIGSPDPTAVVTRVLDLYTCNAGVSPSACKANPIVHVEVGFGDQDANGVDNCYVFGAHTAATGCGATMTVLFWDVTGADT